MESEWIKKVKSVCYLGIHVAKVVQTTKLICTKSQNDDNKHHKESKAQDVLKQIGDSLS